MKALINFISALFFLSPFAVYAQSYENLALTKDTLIYGADSVLLKKVESYGESAIFFSYWGRYPHNLREKIEFEIASDTFKIIRNEFFAPKGFLGSELICRKNKCVFKRYNSSKQILEKYILVDGKINGKYHEYYSNGNTRQLGRYKLGKAYGTWKTFHENGKLESKGEILPYYTKVSLSHVEGENSLRLYLIKLFNSKDSSKIELISNLDDSTYFKLMDSLQLQYDFSPGDNVGWPQFHLHKNGKWEYWNANGELIMCKWFKDGIVEERKLIMHSDK